MSQATAKTIDTRYEFPLVVWGQYFLASHNIADRAYKRRTHRVVTPEQTIIALDHLLQSGSGVALTHMPTENDLKAFLQKLRTFGDRFSASKHRIVITTTATLKAKLEKKVLPPYLKLFSNTVTGDALYDYVMNTSDLIKSAKEQSAKKQKKESNVVIIKGEKRDPKNIIVNGGEQKKGRKSIQAKEGSTKFDSISDMDEKVACLAEAIDGGKPSEIWRPKIPGRMEVFLASVNGLKNTFDIYANSKEKDKLQGTAFEKDVDYFFSLKLKRAQVLFKTRAENPNPDMASFYIPDDMFEVQRRFQFRLSLDDADNARVTHFPHDQDYEMYNISASGVAFFIPQTDSHTYEKGKILKDMHLHIGGKTYPIAEARVQHVSTLHHFDTIRVFAGIQFLKVDPKTTTSLAYFVIKRSLEYLDSIKTL